MERNNFRKYKFEDEKSTLNGDGRLVVFVVAVNF